MKSKDIVSKPKKVKSNIRPAKVMHVAASAKPIKIRQARLDKFRSR